MSKHIKDILDLRVKIKKLNIRHSPDIPIYFECDGQRYEEFYLYIYKRELFVGVETKNIYPIPESEATEKNHWLHGDKFPDCPQKELKKQNVIEYYNMFEKVNENPREIYMSLGSGIFKQKFEADFKKDSDGEIVSITIKLVSYQKNRYEHYQSILENMGKMKKEHNL